MTCASASLPGGRLVLTAPFGIAKLDAFQRVYDDEGIDALLAGWDVSERRHFWQDADMSWRPGAADETTRPPRRRPGRRARARRVSPPLRVVFDLRGAQSRDHPERGIARWVANLGAALARRDDLDDLALMVDPERELSSGYAEMLPAELRVSERDLPRPPRDAVTVFHLGSPFEFDVPTRRLLPGRLSAPNVVHAATLYDVIPMVHPDAHEEWLMRAWRWRAQLVRTSDLVLAISAYTAADGIGRLGLRPDQVRTVGTGVPAFTPPPPRADARPRPFVLYAGGTEHPRKNLPALVRAFGMLPQSLADHELVIAGRIADEHAAELRGLAAEAGIGARLDLVGFVSDEELSSLYAECRCSVYPSTYEGFGLPIAEAMARGAPVVASRTTSCGELLTRPEAGFDPGDLTDMSGTIARVLTDRELATTLSREGRAAAAELTWDAVAERAVAAYREKATAEAPRRLFRARVRRPTFWILGSPDVGTPAAGLLQIALASAATTPVTIATTSWLRSSENVRIVSPVRPEGRSGLQPGPVVCLVDSCQALHPARALLDEREGLAVLWEVDRLVGAHLDEGVRRHARRELTNLAATGAHLVVGSEGEAATLADALPELLGPPTVVPPPIAWNVATGPGRQRLSLEAGFMLTPRRRPVRGGRTTRLLLAPRPPRYGPWPRAVLMELARLASTLRRADPRNRLMVLGDAEPDDASEALEWCQLRHAGAALHIQPWPAYEEMAALLTAADAIMDHGEGPASLGDAVARLARMARRPVVSARDQAVAWDDAMTRARVVEDAPEPADRAPAAIADLLLARLPRPIPDRP